MKKIIKLLMPPLLLLAYKKLRYKSYGWKGEYSHWEVAENDAVGYSSTDILEVVRYSVMRVKVGECVYERDGVNFDEIQYSWPLLSVVLLSGIGKNEINLIDFGGSLGSSYYQNKIFLDKVDKVKWNIVEQRNFVDEGKKNFETDRLKFFNTVDDCFETGEPNIFLMSSVLQYIEKPYDLLETVLEHTFDYIIFDRTPFSLDGQSHIKLQVVPPSVYKASYACWFLCEKALISYLKKKGYRLLERFIASDYSSDGCEFKGLVFCNDD